MPSTPLAYRLAARAAAGLTPALRLLGGKIRTGDEARRGAGDRLRRWAEASRDRARPLSWLHASSVGEGLQAESVLAELRRLLPHGQYVYTHFSPSAEPLARRLPVDAADYLPYDLPDAAAGLLEALQPDLLAFAKLDLWPELATQAATSGVAVAIVAGTVSPGSGRLRWPARWLLNAGYRSVTAAGVISPEDGERLARLGVQGDRILVLGDPRFDSAVQRVKSVGEDDPLLRFGQGAPTMVAGSTWPDDERILLEAFAGVRQNRPDARLILVPHEPTGPHLAAVARLAARLSLPAPVRLSGAAGPAPLLLVDRVGALATLYGAGSMAYVGGGFGRAGLHSVLEPAAWGVPVAFGPRWQNSRDARLLLEAGAAETLRDNGGRQAGELLAGLWQNWIRDPRGRAIQGARAREVVEGGLGAARRSAEMLAGLISSRPPRTSPPAE